MKFNIFLFVLTFVSFTFTSNAQNCCASTAKSISSSTTEPQESTKLLGANLTKDYTSISDQSGSDTTIIFKVYGNCGMCEKTIEGSLKDIEGISKSDWNKLTKMMEVTYDENHITSDDVKRKIAAVGYDMEKIRATDVAYNSLPGCCQYDRPENLEKIHDTHEGHSH